MTKEQRRRAMGQVVHACLTIKDKKPLSEAVRKIVDDLRAEEAAHRQQAAAEAAANAERNKIKPPVTKDRRFSSDVGHAIKRLSDEEFARIEDVLRGALDLQGVVATDAIRNDVRAQMQDRAGGVEGESSV